jgi:hypothetical protein
MKPKIPITTLCLAMAIIPSTLFLHPRSVHAEDKVKKSELANNMEDVDEMMKKLRRSIRKPEADAQSLQLIVDLQKQMLTCKTMTPSKAAKLPESDRPKFIAAYRREMAGVIINFCELEQAILDGDHPKAIDIYKSITDREDKAHDQFMEKDQEKP